MDYIENCMYDMRRSKEASHDAVLCNHMEEFATVCSIKGMSVAWRTPTRCSKLNCGILVKLEYYVSKYVDDNLDCTGKKSSPISIRSKLISVL